MASSLLQILIQNLLLENAKLQTLAESFLAAARISKTPHVIFYAFASIQRGYIEENRA
jgi:hypothetical protein